MCICAYMYCWHRSLHHIILHKYYHIDIINICTWFYICYKHIFIHLENIRMWKFHIALSYGYTVYVTVCNIWLCICTEFPTNSLEMTAVANIFDVNGDGFIDYYEFVSALHPSRDPYRKTIDADQINEEVCVSLLLHSYLHWVFL